MKKHIGLIAGLLVLAAAVFFGYDFISEKLHSNQNTYSYREFYNLVQDNRIEKVTFDGNKIQFVIKGEDKEYEVQNPASPSLKETLLLNDVEVSEKVQGDVIFSNIMDVIFYLIFFGAIAVAFKKVVAPNSFKVVRKTGKNFNDIVGMDSLKKEFSQIMDMMHNPSDWKKKGLRMPKGVILEGEPGNGKTLFAKALAGEASVNFIPTKATDFESMFMALGPMKVKMLFKKARRLAPCIVFIDEFDGIGTKRNYSGSAIETENTRIVTALLNELDGFKDTEGVLVLAATNSISALDEALIRPGRFDARVKVPYPDEKNRTLLINMYTKNKKIDKNLSAESLSKKFNGFSCAKIESVLNEAGLICQQMGEAEITEEHINLAVKKM